MALIICFGTKSVSNLSRQSSLLTETATQIADGAIRAVADVQAFRAEDLLAERHLEALTVAIRWGVRKSFVGAAMLGAVYTIAYAANSLAFWEGAKMIASGSTHGGAGTVYAVVFLILDASFVIGQFGPFIQTFALAAVAGGNIFELLDHIEPYINVYSSEGLPATRETFSSDISFHPVSFVYPARPTIRVLQGLHARIKPGSFVGIAGVSGSGKSTISSLLLRLYDPNSGKITIGNRDIREFNMASWRSYISVVDQDSILFSGTILENICHGLAQNRDPEHIKREKCIKAKEANAWRFIETLDNGIDTPIGDSGGTQLSGGQKQRICFARALVGDPALLILDEYTSALDSVAEASVLDALRKSSTRAGRTVIMIAHRLATIKDADSIIVMAHGELLEQGAHEELVSHEDGAYHAIFRAQQLSHSDEISPLRKSKPSLLRRNTSHYAEKDASNTLSSERLESLEVPSLRLWSSVKRCLRLSRNDWPLIELGMCASIVTGGIVIAEAVGFSDLIQILNGIDSPQDASDANQYCLIFFILAIVAFFAYTVVSRVPPLHLLRKLTLEHLVRCVRDVSVRTIPQQDLEWFSQPGRSCHNLVASISKDSCNLSGLSGVLIGTIFCVLTSVIGGIVLSHIIAWKIVIVLLAATPLMVLSGFLRIKILSKFEQRHETAYNAAASLASEACSAISTVAALGREQGVLEEFKIAIRGPYRDSIRFSAIGNLVFAFSLSITYFIYALSYWWGSRLVRSEEYSVLQFFIVLPVLLFSAQSCGQMFSLAPEFTKAFRAASSVFALHDQQRPSPDQQATNSNDTLEMIHEKILPGPSTGSEEKAADARIEFRNIGLTYSTPTTCSSFHRLEFYYRAWRVRRLGRPLRSRQILDNHPHRTIH